MTVKPSAAPDDPGSPDSCPTGKWLYDNYLGPGARESLVSRFSVAALVNQMRRGESQASSIWCPFASGRDETQLSELADGHFSFSYLRHDFPALKLWAGGRSGLVLHNEMVADARSYDAALHFNRTILLASYFKDSGSQGARNCGLNRGINSSMGSRANLLSRRACFGNLYNETTNETTGRPTGLKEIVEQWPPAFAQTIKDLSYLCREGTRNGLQNAYAAPEGDFDRVFVPNAQGCSTDIKACKANTDDPSGEWAYNELLVQTWAGVNARNVPLYALFYHSEKEHGLGRLAGMEPVHLEYLHRQSCKFEALAQRPAPVVQYHPNSTTRPFTCPDDARFRQCP